MEALDWGATTGSATPIGPVTLRRHFSPSLSAPETNPNTSGSRRALWLQLIRASRCVCWISISPWVTTLTPPAQAHVDRATAYLSLGQVEGALGSYEAALSVEARRPNSLTQAYLDLPFVVACQGIVARYEQALDLLDRHRPRLTFPVDHFRWHTSRALISSAVGVTAEAQAQARLALTAAEKDLSGFRYHPSVGLVGDSYQQIRQRLVSLAA